MNDQSNEPPPSPPRSRRPIAIAALVWVVLTAIGLLAARSVYSIKDPDRFAAFVREGTLSDVHITLMSVALSWALLGGVILLLYFRRVTSRNIISIVCFFCISLLYINVLRERAAYGDIEEYIKAAFNLRAGEPLHSRYLYPPLWATLLKPLTPLGGQAIFHVCWLLNHLSLWLFYWLLLRTLRNYGFSRDLAALVTFAFMLINVPILRTLGFVQVNLHVANLLLISLLCYPNRRWASALALSVAVHLKVSPVVLAVAFLANRDWRWIAWFLFWTAGIAAATIAANGFSPYADFLRNIHNISGANEIAFRENSIDSFFRALGVALAIGDAAARVLTGVAKAVFCGAALLVTALCVKRRTFCRESDERRTPYNATPVLLILMVMASPLVWEHHAVLLSLSYLVMLPCLSSERDWLLFGFAYCLEYVVPTFDFFPWSYGRLLSPVIWLGLAWSLSKQPGPSRLFSRANEWLEARVAPQTG